MKNRQLAYLKTKTFRYSCDAEDWVNEELEKLPDYVEYDADIKLSVGDHNNIFLAVIKVWRLIDDPE